MARLALLSAFAIAALGTGTAHATTVSSAITTRVNVTDNGAVSDNLVLTVGEDGAGTHQVTVTDSSQPLTPGTNCVQGTSPRQVVCTHTAVGGKFLRTDASLGSGDDRFTAQSVDDFGVNVNGGDGQDDLTGSATDATTVVTGGTAFDTLSGSEGDDTLNSRRGDDLLLGDNGTDLLIPSRFGGQRLFGGAGTLDRVSYVDYTANVSAVIGGGAVSGAAGESPKDQIEGDVEVVESGPGADTLVGDADAERFDGGAGADNVDGNGGTDVVTYEQRTAPVTATLGGTAGVGGNEDTITEVEQLKGGTAGDQLTGDGGPNLLDGGHGGDTLTGADGDDSLLGGFGPDDHVGGAGVDEASYRDRTDRVSTTVGANGASGNFDDGPAGSRDTIRADVERTVGSSDDDVLTGDGGANELQGAGGADTLRGQGANDLLSGGHGPDLLDGAGGSRDVVSYAERNRPVSVTIGGGAGASGGREDGPEGTRDTVNGNVEDIVGGAGADTLVGSSAGNILDGGRGGDNMQGLGGADTVTYAARTLAVNVTVGAAGASGSASEDSTAGVRDTVTTDIETVLGGSANDTLTGADGAQTLDGRGGDDTLAGGDDPDDLVGGDGRDTANYASTSGSVTATIGVVGASGTDADGAVGARDTVRGDVERLVSGTAPDTLIGSSNDDELVSAEGDDTLRGAGGNDILTAGLGEDTLQGEAGDDRMSGQGDNDTFDGGGGADRMDGFTSTPSGQFPGDTVLYDQRTTAVDVIVDGGAVSGGTADESAGLRDELINIETVIGGQAADRLQGGNSLANLVGGAGGDTLIGGNGRDLIEGGTGIDDLDGRLNNDTLDGGTERDTLAGGENDDLVRGGDGSDDLDGGNGVDDLRGQAGTDLLEGGAQDDELDGGGEADELIGGFGADLIDGGTGADEASYADRNQNAATAGVVAAIGPPGGSGNADDGVEGQRDTIATDVENLTGGIGNDTLAGNGAANEVNGGDGADSLRGGHGPDEIRGGAGNDSLFSRDESSDDLFCEGGTDDRAEVDALDVAAADCETVVVG